MQSTKIKRTANYARTTMFNIAIKNPTFVNCKGLFDEADDAIRWNFAYHGRALLNTPMTEICDYYDEYAKEKYKIGVVTGIGVFVGKAKARKMYKNKETLNADMSFGGQHYTN